MRAQLRFTPAIGHENIFLEIFSADGGRIGWTLKDAASTETLKMHSKDGVTLTQWTVPQFEAPVKNRFYLIVPHRMGGKGSLNCRSHRSAFGRVVGEEKQRGPGGEFEWG
jgi:hypothetical protein